MTELNTYEQPTNERIRSFLRLEKLFDQYTYHIKQGSVWDNPVAIDSINQLLAFTSRGDIKLEILKELERQHARLERLARRPQIDHGQLGTLLKNQNELIAELKSVKGQPGQTIQNVELLLAIRQKSSVPGCICDFDLPVYQFWLTRPENVRNAQLEQWFEPFRALDKSIRLILDVLRHSVENTDELAENGFFQRSLDTNQLVQLLSISMPANCSYYPEISAGKHRFSIRFMSNDNPSARPEQCKENINFQLRMCTI